MKKSIYRFLIAACLITLAACSSKENQSNTQASSGNPDVENNYYLTKSQFVSSGMELGKLEIKEFHNVVKANGMFDVPPENIASVSTYFGGTVKHMELLPGEQVKKGQVLFILENPEYIQLQQDYLEAKGQLVFLESDYQRQKNLVKENVTSQKNYLQAEAAYTVTKIKIEALSKKLALMGINTDALSVDNIRTTMTVYAPINGFISQVNITRGVYLNPSQTAVTIIDTDHLHIELNIFEKDLPKVKTGQSIIFKLQDDNTKAYKGYVHLINKTVDPEKRTIGIHGHISDKSPAYKFNPGMYVQAEILTTSESGASLPEDALVEVDGKYYVLVLGNSTSEGYSFLKKKVEKGSSNNGYAEILNSQDFNENAQFLTIGAVNLITE